MKFSENWLRSLVEIAATRDELTKRLTMSGLEVAEVTPIPAPSNGPGSDIRVYYAMVDIENGFSSLRPGMSAEISFSLARRLKA